jgi:hypothetical protein
MTEALKPSSDLKYPDLDGKTIINLYPYQLTASGSDMHEKPCPIQKNPDISQDQEINEWVLNKLPLTEAQKEAFIALLLKDQLVQDKIDKSEKVKKRIRQNRREAKGREKTTGVKELTKSSVSQHVEKTESSLPDQSQS